MIYHYITEEQKPINLTLDVLTLKRKLLPESWGYRGDIEKEGLLMNSDLAKSKISSGGKFLNSSDKRRPWGRKEG